MTLIVAVLARSMAQRTELIGEGGMLRAIRARISYLLLMAAIAKRCTLTIATLLSLVAAVVGGG
jgi:hypothetical protein